MITTVTHFVVPLSVPHVQGRNLGFVNHVPHMAGWKVLGLGVFVPKKKKLLKYAIWYSCIGKRGYQGKEGYPTEKGLSGTPGYALVHATCLLGSFLRVGDYSRCLCREN